MNNSENSNGEKTKEQAAVAKKTYKAPTFRFEPVFEVAALACGKVFSAQAGCRFSRKAS